MPERSMSETWNDPPKKKRNRRQSSGCETMSYTGIFGRKACLIRSFFGKGKTVSAMDAEARQDG